MRAFAALLLVLAGDTSSRYGITLDTDKYPQATAKEALASVLKAIGDRRVDYLVAHLASPAFVDGRVKGVYGGNFEEQVRDTRARLDPATVKLLGRFQKEGKWAVDRSSAVVTLDDVPDRQVRLTRGKGGRWYLEHPFAAPATASSDR